MKQHIISALVISSLMAMPVMAQEQQDNQTPAAIGFGSGMVLGAVVGGPVGAIVGAFSGSLVGKSVGDDKHLKAQQQTLDEQAQQITVLNQKQQSLEQLQAQYTEAQRQLKTLQAARASKLEELTVGMNVQFRTGTAEIEPHFAKQLQDIAFAMSLAPELTLDLSGYADRRGSAEFNQQLSEQRVQAVREFLIQQGVNGARLTANAYGASAPLNPKESLENDFFDRRVTLRLQRPDAALAANNQ
ncbi:sortase-associated OmpA-like protein PdsO [Shewanella sp. A32]|uniref:sortase-associated OmpA-like protein PdsO n=1 Tax=Shewanella sp. A32 TaxID=3031327 RepID=UPI0023B98F4B|nr:sortase-associated OmpA-like protein PdsO [Shewanella sp. A32]MDF0533634.1 sortase-associated OmpA-like protein PdsO [Shewanella sp. A32]